MMKATFGFLWSVALLQRNAAASDAFHTSSEVEDALISDDQCTEQGPECAVNALQLRKTSLSAEEDEDGGVETAPNGDITLATERRLLANASAQQKVILEIWTKVAALGKQVNASIKEVEAASNLTVVWNENFDDDSLLEAEENVASGRRRQRGPPRETKVVKTLTYLEKEMDVVFKSLNVLDRMNAGIGDLMVAHYSPDVRKVTGGEASDAPSLSQFTSSLEAPGDHQGKADELRAHLISVINMINRAEESLDSLEVHIKGIRETVVGWLLRWK